MCGIIGYIGRRRAVPILLDGLIRVEYRGYDSAGIAIIERMSGLPGISEDKTHLLVCKQKGKIGGCNGLERVIIDEYLQLHPSTIGIAHTRWATHGIPSDENAHPHLSCRKHVAVVHNGIIENFSDLRGMLLKRNHQFRSDTDTEVLAHLIGEYLDGDPLEAVRTALTEVKGTYGLAVLFSDYPNQIVFARKGSPLCLGLGGKEYFVASDAASFRKHTDKQIILEDGQIGLIMEDGYEIMDMDKVPVSPKIQTIEWELAQIEKEGFPHFMLKEIYEQSVSLARAIAGRIEEDGKIKLAGLLDHSEALQNAKNHLIVAAGTSLNAGLVGEILFQEIAKIPAQAKNASELASQKFPCLPEKTLGWVISQSGETADVLEAMKAMKRLGMDVSAICNVVGSSISHNALTGVYIHAGPEIGVASTKAFTGQIIVLHLISLFLRQIRDIENEPWMSKYMDDLKNITEKVKTILGHADQIKNIAEKYARYTNFLYLGRGINFPTAREGALKLKEISYIHAEGYEMGEMKHGPLALINENFPTVCIVPKNDDNYGKIISNISELTTRKGPVIAIANEGDKEIGKHVNDVIYIPSTTYYLTPILFVIPLQLFAYYAAVKLGQDVDQPRNLAKSVTVE